ncbi:MAG: tetratricopeptide repeat protein [Chitinophagales bacterium]|nr:tetratricopeptide repeat protein [Chitinophagales bacterium]
MHKSVRFTYIIALLVLLSACSSTKKTTQGKSKLTEEQLMKIQGLQLDAERAKLIEDNSEAIKKYNELLQVDPQNDNAYYQLAMLHFQSNKMHDAEFEAEQAAKLAPSNKWYTDLLSKIYTKSGNTKMAIKTLEQVIQKNPTDPDSYFDLAYLYLQSAQPLNAIRVYDQFEKNYGLEESVVMQKEKLYLKLNQFDKAVGEIKKLIDAYPGEVQYLGMLAELYALNGKREKASEVYQQILAIDPENAQALLATADISASKGDTVARIESMRKVFANPNMNIDSKVRMLLPYIQYYEIKKDKIVEAQELSDILVKTHPDESKAHAIRGDVYYIDKKDDTALVAYNRAIVLRKDIFNVWLQTLIIYSSKREWSTLEKTSSDALELFPNQAIIYLYKGNAEYQLKNYEKAIKTFSKGEKMSGDNAPLKAQMLANLGDVYFNLKKNAESDSAYDRSLKLNPESAYTLNNYSYYLSLRKENLEKAKQMSAYANKLEPDNDSFEDTYAWILFQLGDYKEAKVWQEKAIGSSTTNGTLLEHYGDILFKLGDIDKAIEQWKKAKSVGSESKTIDAKIASKSYVEE